MTSLLKKLLVSIPRVRGFYEHKERQSAAIKKLRDKISALEAKLRDKISAPEAKLKISALEAKLRDKISALEANLRDKISALEARDAVTKKELASAQQKLTQLEQDHAEEREKLQLQLYVLRSDFQRAVTLNEQLRSELLRSDSELPQESSTVQPPVDHS